MVLDLELYSRLLMAGGEIVGSKEVGFEYRRHHQSTTAKLTSELTRFKEEWRLYHLIGLQAKEKMWVGTYRQAKWKWMLRIHSTFCSFKSLLRLRFSDFLRYLKLVFKR